MATPLLKPEPTSRLATPDARATRTSYAEEHLAALLDKHFPHHDFVREHQFHPTRKWRFDFASPALKLAIEIQGNGGGHQRVASQRKDCEKNNHALALGWRTMTFLASDARTAEDEWIPLILSVAQLCRATNPPRPPRDPEVLTYDDVMAVRRSPVTKRLPPSPLTR